MLACELRLQILVIRHLLDMKPHLLIIPRSHRSSVSVSVGFSLFLKEFFSSAVSSSISRLVLLLVNSLRTH